MGACRRAQPFKEKHVRSPFDVFTSKYQITAAAAAARQNLRPAGKGGCITTEIVQVWSAEAGDVHKHPEIQGNTNAPLSQAAGEVM